MIDVDIRNLAVDKIFKEAHIDKKEWKTESQVISAIQESEKEKKSQFN